MKSLFVKIGTLGAAVGVVSVLGLSNVASAQPVGYGYGAQPYWGGFNNFNPGYYPGGGSIYGTGPWSNNSIASNNFIDYNRINNNNIAVNNNNVQNAVSGPASVFGNTFGGNAWSGPASNVNNTNTNIGVRNY